MTTPLPLTYVYTASAVECPLNAVMSGWSGERKNWLTSCYGGSSEWVALEEESYEIGAIKQSTGNYVDKLKAKLATKLLYF